MFASTSVTNGEITPILGTGSQAYAFGSSIEKVTENATDAKAAAIAKNGKFRSNTIGPHSPPNAKIRSGFSSTSWAAKS
jgi:hypothetical protein